MGMANNASMTIKKITLYYADWCGHCHRFLPEWYKLKNIYNKYKNEIAEQQHIEIMLDEYMADTSKWNELDEKIKEKINGYPTIHINYGEITEYNGERTALNILKTLLSGLFSEQNINSDLVKKIKEDSEKSDYKEIIGLVSLASSGDKKISESKSLMNEISNIANNLHAKHKDKLQNAGNLSNKTGYYYKMMKYIKKCQQANIMLPDDL